MSSFGNAIERWSVSDLRHQINANDYTGRLSPAQSIAAVVDSAYSSFSGSSYAADYQTSFQSDSCHLSDEQQSYMDSEYVKAIYNSSAVDCMCLNSSGCLEDTTSDAIPTLRETDSSWTCNMSTHISPPESHSPRMEDLDWHNMHCSHGSHLGQKLKRSPPGNRLPDNQESNRQYLCPMWMKSGLQGECKYENPLSMEAKETNYNSRSFFALQSEFPQKLEPFSQPNALSCPSDVTGEVDCTYENKHLSDINKMNKDFFQEMDLEKEGTYTSDQFNVSKESFLTQNIRISEPITSSKTSKHSLNEWVSEGLIVYENKYDGLVKKLGKETQSSSPDGTISKGHSEQGISPPSKEPNQPFDHYSMDIDCDSRAKWDIKHKQLDTRDSQVFHSDSDQNSFGPLYKEGTKIHSLRKDATIKTIPRLSVQLKTDRYYDWGLTSEKITKEATPMLYHLSGGRDNLFTGKCSTTNLAKPPEHNLETKTFQRLSRLSSSQTTEVQKDVKQLCKNKSQCQLAEITDSSCDDGTHGSQTSSAEECLMLDYREKLKVAQKKVLRETSFKRKDLQMSLPGRLKLNPSKRPSIDHLRSYSLSSANEDFNVDNPKNSVDANSKKEEYEKSTVSRIGGRKRITKEQRKLCYSEPEKLDHLGIHNTGFTWKEEGTVLTKNKICDSDVMQHKVRTLESRERTLSSSNLSKTELKQIQHNALVQYIERKTNQRSSSSSQSHMPRTSGMQKYERKSMPNNRSCNDLPQMYLHRRSTGASSSYDATVTWNDRFIKPSLLGASMQSVNINVEEKCMTYTNQCTSEEDKKTFEESPPACWKKTKTSFGQVSNGCTNVSASALCNNQGFNHRLSDAEDRRLSDSEKGSTARGRGKSMEEIGSTDIVRLSVLSQSTDQLYHMKEPKVLPRTESASSTSVVHQEKLWVSTVNDLGNVPSQTSKENFVRLPRSDVASSARDRHSRPSKASAISSTTDNSTSHSGRHSEALEKTPSLEIEDEVFSQAVAIRKELSSRIPIVPREESRRQLPNQDDAPFVVDVMSGHGQLEHRIVNYPSQSSETVEKDVPEDSNEVRHDPNDLRESSAVRKSLPREDCEETKSAESKSMSDSQSEEPIPTLSSQVNALQSFQFSAGQSKNFETTDVVGQEPEASMISSDPGTVEDSPRVHWKTSRDERHAKLVKDILAEDKSLVDILDPLPVRESAMDLMKNLFPVDILEMERCRSRQHQRKDNEVNLGDNKLGLDGASKLPPKTLLLLQNSVLQKPECPSDLTSKKIELISNISTKLLELCEQRESLLSDLNENLSQGKNMESVVKEICKPNEYERYMMFIGDLEKVVSLLFCLSMRLARVENALSKIDDNTDAEEMQSLKERHNLLSRQREDAKDLKENLDRRERVVTGILEKYLNEHQLEDYKHFVRLKTSFLIEQKDLDEKIKFHEEQLESLQNSIPPS
ncbi:protein Shroom1 [Spea bombifrons]|uniref:protein Shroom1 n=1 Tax=Spea bombifrons TaxID=233779 RepID=UPI00234AAE12|nr:protein Shroom1 [Spea bombifrons]